MTTPRKFREVYALMFSAYGPQHWWPGETPFEIMVGAVLTQNTSWSNVEKAIAALKHKRCLHPQRIIDTDQQRLAGWLKPVGYFNIKAQRLKNFCLWYLQAGQKPSLDRLDTGALRRALLSVNGVGPETADDILLYVFARPVFVIDAYTRRLFARLAYIDGEEGYEELRALFEAKLAREPDPVTLFNEYHALIVHHAKYFCRTRPVCTACCLRRRCPSRVQ